ncbi:hypothetical protein J7K93_02580 [bacterium]|nr:hypothetical protein [bacterium]
MDDKNGSVSFAEVQYFRQIWILLTVFFIAVFMWYTYVRQIIFNQPFGNNPMPDTLLVIFMLIFGLGMPWLFIRMRLFTEVREDGIYLKFFPFNFGFHKIVFDDIEKYEIREYHPIKEYGGWGIKSGSGGKAYNVSGNMGLQLKLKNGKKVLIGTQRPEEFKLAVESKVG